MDVSRDPIDLIAFLRATARSIGDELELTQIRAGDRLLVRTRNTHYLFQMTGPHDGVLSSDRADRPAGPVRINGCTFGGSTIKPNHLFCGGNLEFTYQDGVHRFTTTPIVAIQLASTDQPAA